jgi:hypothetical protein
MKKVLLNFLLILQLLPCSAQVWVLKSNRTFDPVEKSYMHEHAIITIDSTDFIIRSGEKNYFYTITQQALTDDGYYYGLMDDDSAKAVGLLNPVHKVLDFVFKGFRVQYQLDSIAQPDKKRKDSIDRAHDTTKIATNVWDTSSTKKTDDSIYLTPDQMPEYSGGDDAMKAFLQKNVKMPKAGVAAHAIGEVDITAVIEKNGSVTHVNIAKDIGYNCGTEAVRVVKSMPNWLPGSNKGEPVRVQVTIPVMFLPPAK